MGTDRPILLDTNGLQMLILDNKYLFLSSSMHLLSWKAPRELLVSIHEVYSMQRAQNFEQCTSVTKAKAYFYRILIQLVIHNRNIFI